MTGDVGYKMKIKRMVRVFRGFVVVLACFGLLIPQVALGANPVAGGVAIDVALEGGGVLSGTVVNADGVALVGTPVVLLQNGREIASATTDDQGQFKLTGVRGGVYQIATAAGGGIYRLWAPGTAPPSAEQAALVVAGDDVVRGQFGSGALGLLSNPWVIGGFFAAAIAIPLAVNGSGS